MAPSSSNLKQNKNGGTYVNGKSLPLPLRKEIVQRYVNGERVVSIGRSMKLTHGVVSKITLHYTKTGSYLPRNIRSFRHEPAAPISNNAIPAPSQSPSSSDADYDEYIDVVSFTPPPVNAPYSVDSILSKPAQPAVDPESVATNPPNPIPLNAFMPNPPLSTVQIIPPLDVAQMAKLLQLQSQYLADFMLGNTANPVATANPVFTNPSKPAVSMNSTPMNVTLPNVPMPAVPIIPPLEMTQMAQFLQLQMLSNQFWMDPAYFFRV